MKRFLSIVAVAAVSLAAFSCKTSVQQQTTPDYEMSYTVGDQTIEMVKVPAGYFTMGISADNRTKVGNGLPHEVALDGFIVSAQPVSQALWTAVMGSNPSSVQNPAAPVDMVPYVDVVKFLGKLGKETGKVFAVPTEAQWEYASRVLGGKGFGQVAEWCSDNYYEPGMEGEPYFKEDTLAVNPVGPAKGTDKVVRTAKDRLPVESHTKKGGVGFRLAQVSEETIPESMMQLLTGNTIDRETVTAFEEVSETITVGDVSFRMNKVKGGSFKMGYNPEEAPVYNFKKFDENELPMHEVTLDDFEIGETEVTVALWDAVMGFVPYLNDIEEGNKPVVNVSWYNCQEFISRLNALTGRKFRLPTEAEWEYAARGGQKSKGYSFSGSNAVDLAVVFVDNGKMKVQPVKSKKANELGLYDMCGNAWEWCYDRSGSYPEGAQTNPVGPAVGSQRVLRGGSAASKWDACRITNRSFIPAKNIKGTFGFRLAL